MKLKYFQDDITVVILSGGRGSRLGSFTDENPKPMIEVCGIPLLQHIILSLLYQNIKNFIILSGYKDSKINNYFLNINSNTCNNKVEILRRQHSELNNINSLRIIYTGQRNLTEKRIFESLEKIKTEYTLILYGDGLGNINITTLYNFMQNVNKKVIITAFRPRQKYGVLTTDIDNNLISLTQNGKMESLINIGYILADTAFLKNHIKNEDSYFEDNFLQNPLVIKNTSVFEHKGEWLSLDSIRDHEIMEAEIAKNETEPFYLCK